MFCVGKGEGERNCCLCFTLLAVFIAKISRAGHFE